MVIVNITAVFICHHEMSENTFVHYLYFFLINSLSYHYKNIFTSTHTSITNLICIFKDLPSSSTSKVYTKMPHTPEATPAIPITHRTYEKIAHVKKDMHIYLFFALFIK